jgi:hypothetical protein
MSDDFDVISGPAAPPPRIKPAAPPAPDPRRSGAAANTFPAPPQVGAPAHQRRDADDR